MKYVKLFRIGLLAVLMAGLTFVSCFDDDDEDQSTPASNPDTSEPSEPVNNGTTDADKKCTIRIYGLDAGIESELLLEKEVESGSSFTLPDYPEDDEVVWRFAAREDESVVYSPKAVITVTQDMELYLFPMSKLTVRIIKNGSEIIKTYKVEPGKEICLANYLPASDFGDVKFTIVPGNGEEYGYNSVFVVDRDLDIQLGNIEREATGTHCIVAKVPDVADINPWDCEFSIWFGGYETKEGDVIEWSVDVLADHFATVPTRWHEKPGSYLSCEGMDSDCYFTINWTTLTGSSTIGVNGEGAQSFVFHISDNKAANSYYFKNISFKINGVEVVKNGDLSHSDFSSFYIKKYTDESPVPVTKLDIIWR